MLSHRRPWRTRIFRLPPDTSRCAPRAQGLAGMNPIGILNRGIRSDPVPANWQPTAAPGVTWQFSPCGTFCCRRLARAGQFAGNPVGKRTNVLETISDRIRCHKSTADPTADPSDPTREEIFRDEGDRSKLLGYLAEGAERHM
jgi:hypothetical protein